MNPVKHSVQSLILLHTLEQSGRGESPAAERERDCLKRLWPDLDELEQKCLTDLSRCLNRREMQPTVPTIQLPKSKEGTDE